MTGNPMARLGDTSTHGGRIVTASEDTICNGRGVARVGDWLDCGVHGLTRIITGSPDVICNGRPVARIGSLCECGAVISSGSEDTLTS